MTLKIRCIKEGLNSLTKGQYYEVKSIDDVNDRFLIIDNDRETRWSPKDYFEFDSSVFPQKFF